MQSKSTKKEQFSIYWAYFTRSIKAASAMSGLYT